MKPAFLFLALVVIGALEPTAAGAGGFNWSYHGFVVTGNEGGANDSFQRAVAEQIDLIESVGLPREFLDFFKSVPLVLVSAPSLERGNPGLYHRTDRAVKLTTRLTVFGRKPVLLHELLHAYHDQKIAHGFGNPGIARLFAAAEKQGSFDPKSHMMQNSAEYFACAGTTYLFGVTAQEPFLRENLKRQPELLEYLRGLFGPTCGRFEGTLAAKSP